MQKTVKGTALRQASTSSGADVRIAEAETELVAAAGAVSSNMSSGIGEVEGSADLGVEEEEVLEEGGGAEVHSDCGGTHCCSTNMA